MGGRFYKTNEDFRDELGLGLKEMKNAKRKLNDLGLVSTARAGVLARTFYTLNESVLSARIPSWAERAQLDGPKGINCVGRNGPTITDNNPKTTQRKDKDFPKLLSSAAAEADGRQLLQGADVHPKVAIALACEQKHPTESIAAAIEKARSRRAWLAITDRFRARLFNIPGYVISSLNQIRRDGHLVKRSKKSRGIAHMARDRLKYRTRDRPGEEETKKSAEKMKKELAAVSA